MSSIVIKSIDRDRVSQEVADHVARLRQRHPEIERVIWFGSWVNGLPTPGSDVDLCLILSSSKKSPRERFTDYLPLCFPVGVDLFTYTRSEFDRLSRSSPGLHKAILSGIDI